MKRESGILLPISSLPSPYGIGCFSREAYEFVDQLKEAGQSYWQILPLGPTSYGDSPYQSFSTFAAVCCTSSWESGWSQIPAAILVMQEIPPTVSPICRAAIASTAVLIPTASAPQLRNIRISAGDS